MKKINSLAICEKLNRGWNYSNRVVNHFKDEVRSIRWYDKFYSESDATYYYTLYCGDNELVLEFQSLDPMEKVDFLPRVWLPDGSGYIEIGTGDSHEL